jgi:cis-3-alkyl-4-acyloxetan-2-one decarboxylase
MGAAVALPDRFARFVLMNTAAFRDDRCPWPIHVCHIPIFGQVAIQGLNLFARAATRMTVAKPERMTEAVKAGYLAPYDSWANRAAVYRFVMDIPLTRRHPSYQTLVDIEQGLSQFRRRPVCFIWGMRDWCFSPRFLDRFLEFFPQAEVHRMDDAGHYVVEDAHERIAPIVETFIANNPLAPSL